MELAKRVADQVVAQITSIRLMAEIRRESKIRDTLAEISRIITSSQDLNDVFGQFASCLRELVPADRIYVRLMNDDETAYRDSYGWSEQGLEAPSTD